MTRSHREHLDQSRTHIMFGRFLLCWTQQVCDKRIHTCTNDLSHTVKYFRYVLQNVLFRMYWTAVWVYTHKRGKEQVIASWKVPRHVKLSRTFVIITSIITSFTNYIVICFYVFLCYFNFYEFNKLSTTFWFERNYVRSSKNTAIRSCKILQDLARF